MTHKTIVVANDVAFVRDRFTSALQGAGHQALPARNAAELMAHLRADPDGIDLLLVDLHLPQAPGVEMIRSIRRLDNGRIPILIFSGTIDNAQEVKLLAALNVAGYVNEYSATEHIMPSLAPHLFPDNFNRRTSPRVVLGIPIAYRHGNAITAALTLNLGKGGLAVRTMTPLDPAARARTRFRLPGAKQDIEAESLVSWSDRRVGMGLQFVQVKPADQASIDEFVDQHFFSQQKSF